jgi:hypothetical protein
MKVRLLKDHNGMPPGFVMVNIGRGAAEILIARGVGEIVEDDKVMAKNKVTKWDRSIQSRRPRQPNQ